MQDAAAKGKGAVSLDGRLIDAASLRMAETLLAKIEQIEAKERGAARPPRPRRSELDARPAAARARPRALRGHLKRASSPSAERWCFLVACRSRPPTTPEEADAVLRVRGARDRQAGGHPGHRLRVHARIAAEAAQIAARIGGPVVIKSQVLTGGRMKAGGVQFADTPDEAERHAARHPRARDQRPHAARRARRPARRRSSRSTTPASSGTASASAR